MSSRIPVTVVTGFLGAGKTTLVERWLGELGADTAVILNEWGEIGIDAELLGARRGRLIEIAGGCLCCANQDELALGLASLAEADVPPARVLVETSGAASPAGVVRAVTSGPARERLRLDGVVTVVDGARLDRVLAFDLAVEQLGFADVVVISHADEIDDAEPIAAKLRGHAPAAVVAQAAHGEVRGPAAERVSLLDLLARRDETLQLPPTDRPAHEAIEAVSLRHDGELDEDRFGDWMSRELAEVEARILRLKGIVAMGGVDARVILHGVGEAVEVRLGAPWGDESRTSKLVILGLGLDAAELERGFGACAVT